MAQRVMYDVTKFSSLREMLEIAKAQAGDNIAFKFKKNGEVQSISYNRFYEDVYALGTELASRGISGTHIACVGENSYKWVNI